MIAVANVAFINGIPNQFKLAEQFQDFLMRGRNMVQSMSLVTAPKSRVADAPTFSVMAVKTA